MKNVSRRNAVGLALSLFLLAGGSAAIGQTFSLGSLDQPGQPLSGISAVYSVINASHPATGAANVRTVSLLWSAAPCPGAIKIKQFRPITTVSGAGYRFVDERGPFDISSKTTTVSLTSPLAFEPGDFLGLAVLTDCGSPLIHQPDPTFGAVFSFSGDLKSDVYPPTTPPHPTGSLDLAGYEDSNALFLLGHRFAISVTLTDPRSGRVATGAPTLLTDQSGSFSAPAFTGSAAFPEIVVKMADVTLSPPPFGGSFWVFYGSLTDTAYLITVTDTRTGSVKTYMSSTPFSGGADTAAFPP